MLFEFSEHKHFLGIFYPRVLDRSSSCYIIPEREARVDAVWQQMNKGVSKEKLNSILNKPKTTVKKTSKKTSSQVSSTVSIQPLLCINECVRMF